MHLFHHSICCIQGLERAVVLQKVKRAGPEAPFDVYVCMSLPSMVMQREAAQVKQGGKQVGGARDTFVKYVCVYM